ncbi:MAG: sensor histidine kinase [Lachnospiraceae bacterium]
MKENRIHRHWKQKYTISMRGLLVLFLVLFGMIPLVLGNQTMLRSIGQSETDSYIIEVQNQCQILSSKLTRNGYLSADTEKAILDGEMDTIADIYNGRIVIVNKDYRIIRDTFRLAEGKTHVAAEIIRGFQGETSNFYKKDKHYLASAVPIYDGTPDKNIEGMLVLTASTESIITLMDTAGSKAYFIQIIFGLMLIIAAGAAAKLLMEPFERLLKKLNHVAAGALDTDIITDTYRETKAISQSIDGTLSRLKEADQTRQEFVSNVSHELKTPITSIRVLADSLMGMEEVPVELYREFMEDISDEIDRESKIIDDLLAMVKMDKSESDLHIAQISINHLVEQILKRLRPIANRQNVELILESMREVIADVDEMKLSLAITNLVENAIKYNVEDGWVQVTLDADHKFFYIKVADSGIGISEEYQDRIFDRFYRVDKARSRETGGSGLGLAITRSVVLMHKGAIKLQSKEGEGSIFTLRIPLNYII